MIYVVTNKETGAEVTRYCALSPVESLGDFSTHDHTELPEEEDAPAQVVIKRRLTKLEFIERLGDAAFAAVLEMAKVSPELNAWVEKVKMATPDQDGTSVNLDDPRTIAGVNALEPALIAQGVVASGWADGVLNGQ